MGHIDRASAIDGRQGQTQDESNEEIVVKPVDGALAPWRETIRMHANKLTDAGIHGWPMPEWLPTDPPRMAPALMTAAEAARYLRLSEGDRDIADAITSLEYLVRQGRIRPCRVGKHNRYARAELDRFIRDQTERYGQSPLESNPRDSVNNG